MSKIFVKPSRAIPVFHPDGKTRLKPEGETVDDLPHWHRRFLDGDVAISTEPPPKSKAKGT